MFDAKVLSHGMCCYLAGDFFEQATAMLSGGERLKTDSRCVTCPDVRFTEKTFFESKSVGKTGAAIIYKTRLRRDKQFCNKGRELLYWCWCHRYRVGDAKSLAELHAGLAGELLDVLVFRFDHLYAACRHVEPKLLNNAYSKSGKRLGWGSRGYGWGWNVSMRAWRTASQDLLVVPRLMVYDQQLTNIKVRFGPGVSADIAMAVWQQT